MSKFNMAQNFKGIPLLNYFFTKLQIFNHKFLFLLYFKIDNLNL